MGIPLCSDLRATGRTTSQCWGVHQQQLWASGLSLSPDPKGQLPDPGAVHQGSACQTHGLWAPWHGDQEADLLQPTWGSWCSALDYKPKC